MAGPRGTAKGQGNTGKKPNYYGYRTADSIEGLEKKGTNDGQDAGEETPAPIQRNEDAVEITPITTPVSGVTAPAMVNPVAKTAKERLQSQPTFNDLLKNSLTIMRQNAEKEKTDAGKMQQYYAFTDALNAIGKLGGSAVGSAVGGNVADSAPAVDPYKESRGYLEAFERAKKANDRLRELDEKDFQLALRDEQRAYDRTIKDADNALRMRLADIDRQWQVEYLRIKSEIDQAVAQQNMELKAKLESDMAALNHGYAMQRQQAQMDHDRDMKRITENIVRMQMSGGYGGRSNYSVPFAFNNGTGMIIPKRFYDDMLSYYVAKKKIGGQDVDKENIVEVLRNYPNLVTDYLKMFAMGSDGGSSGGSSGSGSEYMAGGTYNQPRADITDEEYMQQFAY